MKRTSIVLVALLAVVLAGCAGESQGFGLELDIPIIGGSLSVGIQDIKVDRPSADSEAPYFPDMINGRPAEDVLDETEAEALKLLEEIKAKRAALEGG